MSERAARVQAIVTQARALGWVPTAMPHVWSYPGTLWRMRCLPQRCTIYCGTPTTGATNIRTFEPWQLTRIVQLLQEIAAQHATPEASPRGGMP